MQVMRGSGGAGGKADGRIVVLVLFAGAFLLWGIVFFTGLNQRKTRGIPPGGDDRIYRDSTAHPDSLRAWLSRLPSDWVRVTFVEGQGFVILVPCYSSNSTLTLRGPADSLPQVECEYCDSLGRFGVLGIARDFRDSAWELHLHPPAGQVRVLSVNDSLLKRYPEAPFQDRILLWIRPRPVADLAQAAAPPPDSARAPATADTLVFVPSHQENEFEVLRAEDENPEGCGPQAE